MQIFLFGSGDMLLGVARQIALAGQRPILVCAPRHLAEPVGDSATFRDRLEAEGLDHMVSEDVNADEAVAAKISPGAVGLSIGAAWIFKQPFIDRFGGALFNMHNARLPQDRGGGGFSWRIMRGERQGFCVIHKVVPRADAGPIVKVAEFVYPASCRIPADFIAHTLEIARAMLREFVNELISGRLPDSAVAQPEYLSTYWPRLDTDLHGLIDWSWNVDEIERFICAFDDPYKGASSWIGDRRVRLKKACAFMNDGSFHPFQRGIVYRKSSSGLFVGCAGGALIVQSLRDENGDDVMPRVRVGDRFHTPQEMLETARSTRIFYNPAGKSTRPV